MKLAKKAGHILAVGGGKGGVGKSVFSLTLAAILVDMGYKVVAVDLDLGGANLHTYLGIIGRHPTLVDFFQKRAKTLDEILVATRVEHLRLISGAYYSPNMSSPGAALKMKLMRHIQAIEADFVIIDLGAGMDLSTLDFFIFSDCGFIVTLPEPGAVLNAYRFIKGALFRKLNFVFGRHPKLGPMLTYMGEQSSADDSLMLDWFVKKVRETDPDVFPIVNEISTWFQPFLILNRIGLEESGRLVHSLIKHCSDKYSVNLRYLGNLPEAREISSFLLDVPSFLKSTAGKPFQNSLKAAVRKFLLDIHDTRTLVEKLKIRKSFDDDQIDELAAIIDRQDDGVFNGTGKKLWKLRLYFKPVEVVRFLLEKGIKEEVFFEPSDFDNLN